MDRYTAAENWVSLLNETRTSSRCDNGLTRGGDNSFHYNQLLEDPEDPVPTYEEARVASKREARRAMIDDYVVSAVWPLRMGPILSKSWADSTEPRPFLRLLSVSTIEEHSRTRDVVQAFQGHSD